MLNTTNLVRAWSAGWRFGATVLILSAISACSSSPPPRPQAPPRAEGEIGLRPGDAIRLEIWREGDLSGTYDVDDRGIVTLPLLGELDVSSERLDDLRDRLREDYREYVRNPSIQVTILRRINILGAVGQPGLYPVDATISLSDALGMAGGITPTGDPDDIRLVRNGDVIRETLNRATRLAEADIRSGDQIVVGERGWFERNPGALLGSLIAAAAVITTALLR